jgi:hypothetical protein
MFRQLLSGDGTIEHPADRDAIDRGPFDAETDQPARAVTRGKFLTAEPAREPPFS